MSKHIGFLADTEQARMVGQLAWEKRVTVSEWLRSLVEREGKRVAKAKARAADRGKTLSPVLGEFR